MKFDLHFHYEVKEPQQGSELDYKRAIDKMFYFDILPLVNNYYFSSAVIRFILFSWLGYVSNTSVYPMLTCSLAM